MKQSDCRMLSKAFKVLGSESAVKIFVLLYQAGEMCVSDIARKVNLSLSATSHQLRKMESIGLIDSWREGRTICYMLKKDKLCQNFVQCLRNCIIKGRKN